MKSKPWLTVAWICACFAFLPKLHAQAGDSLDWYRFQLTGVHAKLIGAALPEPAVKKRFPVWIPIGALGAGGAVFLLISKRDPGDPALPVAADDLVVVLQCGQSITYNILANDTGQGIRLVSVSAFPAGDVEPAGETTVRITTTAPGTFTYTIADESGRQAVGTVTVQVVLPQIVALNDAYEGPRGFQISNNVLVNDLGARLRVSSFIQSPHGEVSMGETGMFTFAPLAGFCGVTTFQYTARDECGQTATAQVAITIKDPEQPVIECPANRKITCIQTPSPELTGSAQATDDCDPSPVTGFADEFEAGGCTGQKTIYRTWSATDASGHSATCQQIIEIFDEAPPILQCPADVAVVCGQPTTPDITGNAQATDDCSLSEEMTIDFTDNTSGPGDCSISGVILRTWTAADACGNQSTCIQTITLPADVEPPAIACPPSVPVSCGQSTAPEITGSATAADNCSPTSGIAIHYNDETSGSGDCDLSAGITRTWTAADACGNQSTCIQIITLPADTETPAITCPPAAAVSCGQATTPEITGEATAADNCSLPADIAIHFTDAPFGAGNCALNSGITRTWTAADACGNQSTCIQTITLATDQTIPSLTCPPTATVACGQSILPDATGEPGVSDNCTPAGQIQTTYADDTGGQGDCGQTGVILREWRATDVCGNTAACTQIITLAADTEVPSITCPPTITAACGQSVNPAVTGQATATDNCSAPADLLIQHSDDTGGLTGCGGTGQLVRTWTATDPCGNENECIQTILVNDQNPPAITCPPTVSVACGQSTAPGITGFPSGNDACSPAGNLTFTHTDTGGNLEDCAGGASPLMRTWTGTDACGNQSACVQVITITDNQPPAVTCPPAVILPCSSPSTPEVTGFPTATDNCSAEVELLISSNQATGSGCGQIINRVWSATDQCGNVSLCSQFIQYENADCPFGLTSSITPAACGFPNGGISLTIFPSGSYFVTWSNGVTGPQLINVPAGTYNATITNAFSSCTETQLFSIPEEPPQYIQSVSSLPASCNGGGDILLNLDSPAGGPFQIIGEGPAGFNLTGVSGGTVSLSEFTFLPAGAYTLQVLDQTIGPGCVSTADVAVEEGAVPYSLQLQDVINPSSPSASDGVIILAVVSENPLPPYLIFVNGAPWGTAPGLLIPVEGLPAGVYTIHVVELAGSGCPSESITVELNFGEAAPPWSGEFSRPVFPFFDPFANQVEHPVTGNNRVPFVPMIAQAPGFSAMMPVSKRLALFSGYARFYSAWTSDGLAGPATGFDLNTTSITVGMNRIYPFSETSRAKLSVGASRLDSRLHIRDKGLSRSYTGTHYYLALMGNWDHAIPGGPVIRVEAGLRCFPGLQNGVNSTWQPYGGISILANIQHPPRLWRGQHPVHFNPGKNGTN